MSRVATQVASYLGTYPGTWVATALWACGLWLKMQVTDKFCYGSDLYRTHTPTYSPKRESEKWNLAPCVLTSKFFMVKNAWNCGIPVVWCSWLVYMSWSTVHRNILAITCDNACLLSVCGYQKNHKLTWKDEHSRCWKNAPSDVLTSPWAIVCWWILNRSHTDSINKGSRSVRNGWWPCINQWPIAVIWRCWIFLKMSTIFIWIFWRYFLISLEENRLGTTW